MKSGKCLKELRGHESYVTDAKYTEVFLFVFKFLFKDGHQCISSCADGTIKVWNMKSMECINTFRICGDVPVNSIHSFPKSDQFLICNRTNTVFIVNIQGQVFFLLLL